MFNKTELLYIKAGRNERWGPPGGYSKGFSSPPPERKPFVVRKSSISKENRAAVERVRKMIKKVQEG